jgi:hypothetical protein
MPPTKTKPVSPEGYNNVIRIDDLHVTHISKKANIYNDVFNYFKIVDKDVKVKMLQVKSLDKDLKMPFWKDEKGVFMLKVKDKFWIGENYSRINLELNYYCFETDDQTIKGYYAKACSCSDESSDCEKECINNENEILIHSQI